MEANKCERTMKKPDDGKMGGSGDELERMRVGIE